MNGKGDKRRPYDPAKWAAGYEAINWHRKGYPSATHPTPQKPVKKTR